MEDRLARRVLLLNAQRRLRVRNLTVERFANGGRAAELPRSLVVRDGVRETVKTDHRVPDHLRDLRLLCARELAGDGIYRDAPRGARGKSSIQANCATGKRQNLESAFVFFSADCNNRLVASCFGCVST